MESVTIRSQTISLVDEVFGVVILSSVDICLDSLVTLLFFAGLGNNGVHLDSSNWFPLVGSKNLAGFSAHLYFATLVAQSIGEAILFEFVALQIDAMRNLQHSNFGVGGDGNRTKDWFRRRHGGSVSKATGTLAIHQSTHQSVDFPIRRPASPIDRSIKCFVVALVQSSRRNRIDCFYVLEIVIFVGLWFYSVLCLPSVDMKRNNAQMSKPAFLENGKPVNRISPQIHIEGPMYSFLSVRAKFCLGFSGAMGGICPYDFKSTARLLCPA